MNGNIVMNKVFWNRTICPQRVQSCMWKVMSSVYNCSSYPSYQSQPSNTVLKIDIIVGSFILILWKILKLLEVWERRETNSKILHYFTASLIRPLISICINCGIVSLYAKKIIENESKLHSQIKKESVLWLNQWLMY